jgi:NADH-quinone oxidoreductase subunit H
MAVYDYLDQIFILIGDRILQLFEGSPSWLITLVWTILKVLPIIAIFPGIFAMTTWAERKLLGRIQNRLGPNRTGPVGLFQPVADGLKTLTKEDIVPEKADKFVHTIAPILAVVPAFIVIAVLPMGRNMTPADLGIGVFFFFATGAISEVAIFLAGWASHNKYSLIGGMRAIAQMISYEIPFVLSAITVIMIVGTLSTTKIVEAQMLHYGIEDPTSAWDKTQQIGYHFFNNIAGWHVFQPWGFFGFIIFFISALAELNRSPFDIPEAESEIIAGHHTEYSGFKFALFALAEYISMIAVCGLCTTLFLGGWLGPKPIPSWGWFFLKVFSLMLLMIWVRGTMPRLRVDQLMGFAWKFLLPMALVNVFAAGLWFYIQPRFLGWIVTAIILPIAYHLLSKAVIGKNIKKRTYRYA